MLLQAAYLISAAPRQGRYIATGAFLTTLKGIFTSISTELIDACFGAKARLRQG
jgi:hypothetical protein